MRRSTYDVGAGVVRQLTAVASHQFVHRSGRDPFRAGQGRGLRSRDGQDSFSGIGASMAMTHADACSHDGCTTTWSSSSTRTCARWSVARASTRRRDAPVVRRIAESVVRDHDERSLTGVVAPVPDVDAVVGELVARVSGFGPLQPFLDDPAVEEVWINSPDRVFVARHGRHELTNLVLTRAQVQELVERMLKSSGRRIDLSQPFVDAMLPEGHRLHVVLEGISRGFSRGRTSASSSCAPTACRAWSSSAA